MIIALDHIFERWDGKGHLGLEGEATSLAARVTHFSHTVVLELWRSGAAAARAMVRRRAGSEFDPTLVEVLLRRPQELLDLVGAESVWETVLEVEPSSRPWLPGSRLDKIAEAFAVFSDLKSAYTVGHCQAVAWLVEATANVMNVDRASVVSLCAGQHSSTIGAARRNERDLGQSSCAESR